MKSWIILIGLAVGLTAVGSVAVPLLLPDGSSKGPEFPAPDEAPGLKPLVEIEGSLTHEFGTLPQQYKGTHAFVVKNVGKGPLEIRGSSSTCQCTNADLFDERNPNNKTLTIEPGGSRSIPVTWKTNNNNGDYRQIVTLATNDPEHPQIQMEVKGVVRPALVTFPADPSIEFLTVNNDVPHSRRIGLSSPDRPETKITRLAASNPALLGVEFRDMNADESTGAKVQKGYTIEVTLKPTPQLGEISEEILVETDHPKQPTMRIVVHARITGPITLLPSTVTVPGTTASAGGKQQITLTAVARKDVKFAVEKKPAALEVAIEPLPDQPGLKGSRYRMTVKVFPGAEPGLLSDEIVLKTDYPNATELKVPVQILVEGSK